MIRPMIPEDSSAATQLVVLAGLFSAEETELVQSLLTDYFAANEAAGHGCFVDDDDGIVGIAYYAPKAATDRTWELLMLAVKPGDQGRGRGAALVGTVEQTLQATGQRLLVIETSATAAYDRTRIFYRQCGYEEEAKVRDYFAAGDDMVIFRKALMPMNEGA
ncbi:GNAT family N-acetyltransferase [Deinococcus oregonensis]|uniref:GNAT family N-acetyltransferase n=1 Tax=Deinococcus oregonensis TaxID=1805970 RepID=A0ABV6AVU9_9DEIO